MVGDHQIGRYPRKMRDVPVTPAPKILLVVIALIAAAPIAAAQDYPTRPITLVVGYAAGGGNDIMARVAAEKMSPVLGQQIVIENRGGAGGSIATRAVAKAAPDGYTLVIGGTGTLAINPTLYGSVGYDPRKDFAPIGLIASSSNVVLVNNTVPVHSIAELIALAKQKPGELTFASTGTGSSVQVTLEQKGASHPKTATVPAKVVEQKNDRSGFRIDTKGGVNTLMALQFKKFDVDLTATTARGE